MFLRRNTCKVRILSPLVTFVEIDQHLQSVRSDCNHPRQYIFHRHTRSSCCVEVSAGGIAGAASKIATLPMISPSADRRAAVAAARPSFAASERLFRRFARSFFDDKTVDGRVEKLGCTLVNALSYSKVWFDTCKFLLLFADPGPAEDDGDNITRHSFASLLAL
eukprot:IDg3069t1